MTTAGSSPSGADRTDGAQPIAESELTDADRIRVAVLSCAGVAGLSGGPLGEIASYLPGRTVAGVRVDDERIEVHIVADYGPSLREVADRIGESVRDLLGGRSLNVAVDDILLPGDSLNGSPSTPGAPGSP